MTPAEITRILARLDMQDELLGEIHSHVKQTNGRVLKLELWQARVLGAVAAGTFFVAAVAVPALLTLL